MGAMASIQALSFIGSEGILAILSCLCNFYFLTFSVFFVIFPLFPPRKPLSAPVEVGGAGPASKQAVQHFRKQEKLIRNRPSSCLLGIAPCETGALRRTAPKRR